MIKAALAAAFFLAGASSAMAQQTGTQQPGAPCVRSAVEVRLGGVDLDQMRCQIFMMQVDLGTKDAAIAQLRAQIQFDALDREAQRKHVAELEQELAAKKTTPSPKGTR